MEEVSEQCDNFELGGCGSLGKVLPQLHQTLALLYERQLWPSVPSQEGTQSKETTSLHQLWLSASNELAEQLQSTIV